VLKPILQGVVVLGVLLAAVAPTQAQSYPDKGVKIVIGVTPGGGLDVLVRGIAQQLTERWGKAVVVDNRPGASGLIAAESVANAAPDGYTWFAVTDQIYLSNRFAFKSLPYNPDTSFANISLLARAEQFVLANVEVKANSLGELVAAERQKPGSFAYGTWGDGSPPQLLYETLNKKTGTGTLAVIVPGAGTLTATDVRSKVALASFAKTKGKTKAKPVYLKSATVDSTGAGTVQVPIKPTAAAMKILAKKGKLAVNVRLTFVPTGGTAAAQSFKVVLKKQLKPAPK